MLVSFAAGGVRRSFSYTAYELLPGAANSHGRLVLAGSDSLHVLRTLLHGKIFD